ncbi:phosphofructokinase [Prosthecochloris aestuarii DSM 271]|uniref:Phosphofructokinase n=1 Tax=Prosthecochloris aestuarii (strain DSM 271 / SK 413) TaxID=290512 RepID=B4S8G9_PROA2|nr:6-phosphofructokinase [Prosthecochloris aestuarii]ACF46356.1 phosphofructokinase [Prosthecochloris aestuarii DSM 271]
MPENALKPPTIFLSYPSKEESFVARICYYLERQARVKCYFNPEQKIAGDFEQRIQQAAQESDYFVLFLSGNTTSSKWQKTELQHWRKAHPDMLTRIIVVNLHTMMLDDKPNELPPNLERIIISEPEKQGVYCSEQILKLFALPAAPFDGLPVTIQVLYEKEIINAYMRNNGQLPDTLISKGYPPTWPKVRKIQSSTTSNPLNEKKFGTYRAPDSSISVDARHQTGNNAHCTDTCQLDLTFPEAGPRQTIIIPSNPFNVAILVSGGIAPGINSIISAIAERHETYQNEYRNTYHIQHHTVNLNSCMEGFNALFEIGGQIFELDKQLINHEANNGGSVIPTARADDLLPHDPDKRYTKLRRIVHTLEQRDISILYIIGGEGSMRAAHAIWTIFHKRYPNKRLSVIGIPKTMDNDILWVWQSIGFPSAVEKARQIIIQLAIEATSNPRVCIMQLFGSSSGYVVSHAALASNMCDLALIPELEFSMHDVCEYMGAKLQERRNKPNTSPYGLIVMAETAIPSDFMDYIDNKNVGLTEDEITALHHFNVNNRKVIGQTPDHLRNAGLKIVSKILETYINQRLSIEYNDNYWKKYRVFTNAPRHIVRSVEPSTNDVAYGIRLGTMAVDMAMAGYTDCIVSQWLTEYVAVPLELVTLGRKEVPLDGIFWKTVIAKTGQIEFESLSGIK